MTPTKRNIFLLIIVNLILVIIVLNIPVRFWHSQKTILKETVVREDKLENELTQSIKNFKELENMYIELKEENIELKEANREIKEQSDIVWNNFTITAYTKYDDGCDNITSIGLDLNDSWTKYFNFVAVDPNVISYGKTVFIKLDGRIIEALAVDCGYLIKGNHIDFYCEPEDIFKIGRRENIDVGWIR